MAYSGFSTNSDRRQGKKAGQWPKDMNMPAGLTCVDLYKREIDKVGARFDPLITKLLTLLIARPSSREVRQLLEHRLKPYRIKAVFKPDPFLSNMPDSQDVFPGDIVLADFENGIEYRIQLDDLVQHLIILGRTGSGKTSLLCLLLSQALRQNVRFMGIDPGHSMRQLVRFGVDVHVFTVNDFIHNFLVPPGGKIEFARAWLSIVVSIMQNTLDVRLACRSVVAQIASDLWKSFGSLDGSGHWPNIIQVYEQIKAKPLRTYEKVSSQYQTLINRFEGIFDTVGTRIFDCSIGFSDQVLFDELNWILEISAPSDIMTFIANILIARLYFYRLWNNQFTSHLRNIVGVDEGSELFSILRERSQDALDYVLTKTVIPRSRALGIGHVVGCQNCDNLSRGLLDNAGIKILCGGALGRGEDTNYYGRCVGMTREQINYLHQV